MNSIYSYPNIERQAGACTKPHVGSSCRQKLKAMSLKQELQTDYPVIRMGNISDEARMIAVAWHENATDWIGDKHKLASDIMNYARRSNKELVEALQLVVGSMSLERVERFDLLEKCKSALAKVGK